MSKPIRKIEPQIIEKDGKPVFAVIPFDQFVELKKVADIYISDESELTIPHEVVKAIISGDTMIKAWREYLGMTQGGLAEKAGMTQPAVAKLEKPGSAPRRATLKKLADAMGISVEQLEE
ncbi:MAG: helix-turn-helix transcriptional regulator [Deltaproteobacteria bacterium]|nr:helix-turn-helix transcriptional regulator [Deltaproteobacteria bacterium]